MKLTWLTDIHLNFVGRNEVNTLCSEIMNSGADAVLITGDIASSMHLCKYLEYLSDNLKRPIYFVLGNHDYYGSSIQKVNHDVRFLAEKHQSLIWLTRSEVVELSPDTCLIGHEGLADGRLGDPEGSQVMLNDYLHIEELHQTTKERRLEVQNKLGDTAAQYIRAQLIKALKRGYSNIIVALHVPPFAEATWHEGQRSNDDFLPHFGCKATGDVLQSVMKKNPGVNMTVFCGHTHSSGTVDILPNLRVKTGSAVYRQPKIQEVLEIG